MMAGEKLAKCLKRLTKARNIARKCRKWIASSRCMDDVCVQVSDDYGYIDILGLTREEQEELERKLKESKK